MHHCIAVELQAALHRDLFLTQFTRTDDGLKVYDISAGSGEEVVKGTKVKACTASR